MDRTAGAAVRAPDLGRPAIRPSTPSLHDRKVRGTVLMLGVVVLATSACTRSDPRQAGGVVEEDRTLPQLQGESVDGSSLDSRDFLGSVLVVNVWATWCEPCRREQPMLESVYERYQDQGVEFLGIDYRDNREGAAAWIKDFGVTYPSLFDPDGRTAALLSFPFVPDTYIVDRDGVIHHSIFGATNEEELSGLIDSVLGVQDGGDP